ncbi:hypothetical protein CEN45_09315 [Fischerella thermalis CCMEE 5198]|nr:hypothetical protein CEN45_09315 [Fischerella thermalis CCMEE 5198]
MHFTSNAVQESIPILCNAQGACVQCWVLFITIAFTLINKSHYHTLGFQPPQSALLKQSQKK